MNNEIWYELFLDMGEEGTKTIKICDNYLEALKEKMNLTYLYGKGKLHIDKWIDTDNPRLVEDKGVRR